MTQPEPTRHRPPGTLAHAIAICSCAGKYLKARADLVKIEAKEAGINYGVALGMVVGALVMVLLGYVFLVITAVFGVAAFFDHRHAWIVVLGIAALIHIGGAVALLFIARKRVKTPVFQTTREELKKDQTWLKTHPSKL